eukprot:1409630-Alexandrium_andersonii.AAC.1
MSASLVGSEMCIRDRMLRGPAAGGPTGFQHSRDSGVVIPLELAHFLGPVSYTHLTLPTICSV